MTIRNGERVFDRRLMSYSIGVDLGGTNIKIVVITNDGEVKAGAIGAAYYGIQEAKG